MNDLQAFYNSILNINNSDQFEEIKQIVMEEKAKVLEQALSTEGFCKYLACQIEYRLTHELSGINVAYLDLNSLVNVDHVALIVEYRHDGNLVRFLIDPAFEQFVKKDNQQLLSLDNWPSELIGNDMTNDLLTSGLTLLDESRFNVYINAFAKCKLNYDLEEYLLNQKMKQEK